MTEGVYMNIKIAPSLLAADPMNLGRDIKRAAEAGADILHIDIMDGVYVPNITLGLPVVAAAKAVTDMELDVHMMTVCPGEYIDVLADFGADYVSVHNDIAEESKVIDILKHIKARGMKPAVAISPDIHYREAVKFLPYVDMVLVMTVQPGFGGQKFRDMSAKITAIKQAADEMGKSVRIEVDGGIVPETAAVCAKAGADTFVAGTYIFKAVDMKSAVDKLRISLEQARK